jgi:ABC-type phosphate transport system substrate-binding protein
MNQWTDDVSSLSPPLQVSYNPTSSGDGRTFFRGGTDAYAVSDIPYQGESAGGDTPPSFPFEYIPIVAGGLGFMYNLPGNPVLRLNADTACGIFTGEITNWDDSALAALQNPGVTLPDLAITPVLRGDLAGTNWVLEDWCMTEAPTVWQSFVSYVNAHIEQFSNSDSPPIGVTTPSSALPVLGNEQTANGDSGTAAVVGSADGVGDITYVEPEYAKEYNNKPVAYVENASGDFEQPTPENVAGALSYASGQSNGIQVLNFAGTGCNVYNPSTYSYLLARTDGAYGTAYGQTLGGFLNYVLTIGEKEAPAIDYATIGLSLEQYGISQAQNIQGYPALTSTEQANFAAGDVTPAIVQQTACGVAFQLATPATSTTTTTVAPASSTTTVASSTTPTTSSKTTPTTTGRKTTPTTAGGTTPTTSGTGSSGSGTTPTTSGTGSSGSGTTPTTSGTGGASTRGASGSASSGSSSSGSGVSAGVSLTGSAPDAQTGGEQLLLIIAGLGIAGASELARRRLRRAL